MPLHAVTSGSRSGSGKIVLEYFDQLKQIWGGSPSTEPLSSGVGTDDFTDSNENESTLDTQLASDDADVEELAIASSSHSEGGNMLSSEGESPSGSAGKKSFKGKKRVSSNPVPKLIDNKRKQLERQLSASQRDQLLINESKEDSQFKRDIAEAIRQSNETSSQAMQQISMLMLQVAEGFTQSIEVLARAMVNKPSQPQYQHTPYLPTDKSAQVRMHGPVYPTGYS